MKNKDILYSVLIATALAINPLMAKSINLSSQNQTTSLSINVAKILQNRGLDDDAARVISEEFFADDEDLFHLMLKNLEHGCSVLSEDEILDYVSSIALQRKQLKLDSYSSLVNMLHSIKKIPPSKETLLELENIAMKNFLFSQSISKSVA
jgi:hypothetical protein